MFFQDHLKPVICGENPKIVHCIDPYAYSGFNFKKLSIKPGYCFVCSHDRPVMDNTSSVTNNTSKGFSPTKKSPKKKR